MQREAYATWRTDLRGLASLLTAYRVDVPVLLLFVGASASAPGGQALARRERVEQGLLRIQLHPRAYFRFGTWQ
jgi:hypothetical protein